jgi:CRP-like cAMP-binding protein
MSQPSQSYVANCLLSALPAEGYEVLRPDLEHVELNRGQVLSAAMAPITHAYFPESGIGSIITSAGELRVETGLFGRDGMSGVPALLHAERDRAATLVQVAGEGHRLPVATLHAACRRSPETHIILLRYAHVLSVQTSYTALSNANQSIEERLARWLLMCDDRHRDDEIGLTHDFLSVMLAVRRPSVTTALHVLEGNRFIRARRNAITILDREGLMEFADGSYGDAEDEYRRLIGGFS